MPESYEFSPATWPMICAAAVAAGVATYAWRRRALQALPLAVLAAVTFIWAVACTLEVAAVEIPDKFQWHKVERFCQLLAASGTLWFALDYAHLNRWLTRWTFAVLSVVPVVFALLIITNDHHGIIWTGFSFTGHDVRSQFGVGKWIFIDYEMLVSVLAALVFIWLFARSPLHRRSIALCLIGLVATRVTYVLQAVVAVDPWGPVDMTVVVASSSVVIYGRMLFRVRTSELVPVAYGTVMNQMREGVLVLDSRHRVIELNPAATMLLGLPAEETRGMNALHIPAFQGLGTWFDGSEPESREIHTGAGNDVHWYAVSRSSLNFGGRLHGHILLVQDITADKRARAEVLEQQCAVVTLRERSILARELHDNIGQVLGFIKMQAQTARDLLAQRQPSTADHCIARLAAAAQDAHVDVRAFIEGAAGVAPPPARLSTSLSQYLERFRESSGMAITLDAPEDLNALGLAPVVEAQLFRIVQEALSNARKHAHARQVVVSLATSDGHVAASIRDDGVGFETAALTTADAHAFGLRFMRERAAEVGGSVGIRSAPGQGTELVIRVPRRSAES